MKYETAVLIGRGACGEVFKAFDPDLGVDVALKLFPTDDGQSDARRLREAHAQSKLSHPSICEVYEVGKNENGRGYIAMRYVDGKPIDQIATGLAIRERVKLISQVADAVACAHEHGLIHRDLKPSNLLVERQPDGSLRPFVLDFGIVRNQDDTRLTETGQVLGTPGYLSPEQARGSRDLDARSDVFSLGVILYQLLTGVLPFKSDSEVGAMIAVLEHQPPLASSVNGEVPIALARIAEKALEKEPRRRYDHARSFQLDLDRFLQAGTVSARGVSLLGRLVRRIELRPVPWAIGGVLLLVVLFSLAWNVRNRFLAERQTRQAESFARRSADIESQLRFLQLLPPRSLVNDLPRLESALDELSSQVSNARGRARAAGEFAVGRGEFALGRPKAAVGRLEQARELGFSDPLASLTLARAKLQLAETELRSISMVADPAVRAAERGRVREELAQEVLPLLQSSAIEDGDIDAGQLSMAKSLEALVREQPEEARRLAEQAAESSPWLFEAILIKAEAYREEAMAARVADDLGPAFEALDQEAKVLQQASVRAPSAWRVYELHCANRLQKAQLEISDRRSKEEWAGSFDGARTACGEATRLIGGSRDAALLLLEVGWREANQVLRVEGKNGDFSNLEDTIELGRSIIETTPSNYDAAFHLGNALYVMARVRRDQGEPSAALFEESAVMVADSLEAQGGSAGAWQSLANIWTEHGLVLEFSGTNPLPSYRRARDAARRGLSGSNVQLSRLLNTSCTTSVNEAYYGLLHPGEVTAEQVGRALEEAEQACQEALKRDPEYLSALSNLGLMYWTEVEFEISHDGDPTAAAEEGRSTFERLLELEPQHLSGRNNFTGMLVAYAAWRVDETPLEREAAGSVIEVLDLAAATIEPVRDSIPADALIHATRLAVLRAAVLCESEPNILDQLWVDARRSLADLEAAGGSKVVTLVRSAELERREAECLLKHQRRVDAKANLTRAREILVQLRTLDPGRIDLESESRRIEELSRRVARSSE